MPNILFLFGLSGAGKTFCGQLISEHLGYFCYDLDRDCTPAMREAVALGHPFTEKMRDDFFLIVCQRIDELKREHPKLVLMQAAYKERHRALIRGRHPEIEMVWIDAPDHLIQERLQTRGGGASAEYASRIRANFEPPVDSLRLVNDVRDPKELYERLIGLFNSRR